jgi:hypothetical protein
VGNGVIYVGGFFDGIGGMAAWNLGALDLVTGAATPSWRPRALHPSLSPPVQALASGGPWVYVGGVFTSFEDREQSHFGAIHGATGTVVDWAHAPNGEVTSITASGDQVVVGGWFDRIAGQKRPGVAVFEVRTL